MTQSIEKLNQSSDNIETRKLPEKQSEQIVSQLHDYLTPKLEIRNDKYYLLGEYSLSAIESATNALLANSEWDFEILSNLSNDFAKKINRDSKLPDEKRQFRSEHLAITQAMKNATGLRALESIDQPIKITFIIPVYGEKSRALSYDPINNPHGQNSVNQKLKQISRMQAKNPRIQYEVIYLDDGDKVGSQTVIEPILKSYKKNIQSRYIRLQDLLTDPKYSAALGGIKSPDESQKGGAVKAGVLLANDADFVILTDADLEMHVEQFGLGIKEMIENPQLQSVSNSRRHEASTQIKTLEGNRRGLLFIALRRALTESSINDSQQTLTLRQPLAAQIISQNMADKFSNSAGYPAVLLAHTERQYGPNAVAEVPTQFNADSSASNFDSKAYVKILKDTYYSFKNYLPESMTAKWATNIILWIEQNPEVFTQKVKDMGNSDFDVTKLDILNREPYVTKPSLRELYQIANYLGVDNETPTI
jgi:glycosyltransferase involved in cell wall biosynthesis